MKLFYNFSICLIIFSSSFCFSQVNLKVEFRDSDGQGTSVDVRNGTTIDVPPTVKDLRKIFVKSTIPAGHKLVFAAAGDSKDYTTPGVKSELTFTNNLIDTEVTVAHLDNAGTEVAGDKIKFNIRSGEDESISTIQTRPVEQIAPSIDEFINQNYSHLTRTPFGLIDLNDEENNIHIFFDYLGNSLLSTVPQGISNAQYLIHIIYPASSSNPNELSYSVKQKTGNFKHGIVANNIGIGARLPGVLQSGIKYDLLVERTILLGTATDDLDFDIISKNGLRERVILESYTIKMSPVFHVSFDVGLLRTKLSNPTYNLVLKPGSTTDKVVTADDDGPHGTVSVMATFYVSPVILAKEILNQVRRRRSTVPFYKLTGRSFLDDHKIYERFYPAVGVSVNNKVLENFFYGVNWEVARGLALFAGWHYGKVRTFEMPGFVPNETVVTDDQFAFYQKNRWKTSTAIGVKLDILILENLFGRGGSGN